MSKRKAGTRMMLKRVREMWLLLVAWVLLAQGVESNAGGTEAMVPRAAATKILILYHPYGAGLLRPDGIRPVPDYNGWPDERMEKDFGRLAALGVDAVLVTVDWKAWVNEIGRRERYERLLGLVAANPAWPRVFWWVEAADDVAGQDAATFVQWAAALAGGKHGEGFGKIGGRRMIALSPALERWPARHPAFTIRFTHPERGEWTWSHPPTSWCGRAATMDQAVLRTGTVIQRPTKGVVRWVFGRSAAARLREALTAVLEAEEPPKILCLASWNDYRSGDFIEPTRELGDAAFKAVRQIIGKQRARQ